MSLNRPARPVRRDALSRLLETERRLAARLEAVEREADAIVVAADAEARRRLEVLDDDLLAEGEALTRSIEAGAANRIEVLRRDADATVARYRETSDATVLQLAREAVAVVVDAEGEDLA